MSSMRAKLARHAAKLYGSRGPLYLVVSLRLLGYVHCEHLRVTDVFEEETPVAEAQVTEAL